MQVRLRNEEIIRSTMGLLASATDETRLRFWFNSHDIFFSLTEKGRKKSAEMQQNLNCSRKIKQCTIRWSCTTDEPKTIN